MIQELPPNFIDGPIQEGGRTFFIFKCPVCECQKKVRKESIYKIKSCFSCHHKVKRPPKPDGEFTWCSKCNRWKESSMFYIRSNGCIRPCKPCETAYRLNHMPQINAYAKIYRRRNINKAILSAAKNRAKENNLPFNLDLSDIVVPEKCPILDIILSTDGEKLNSPSLDRIIPLLGYTKGNVRVTSWRANWIKNNMTKEEVEKLYIDSKKWGCSGSKSVKKK